LHWQDETVALLSAETPDFRPQYWPSNNPDLSPVDYAVCGMLQERIYRCQIRDVNHLKERLIEEWRNFDQSKWQQLCWLIRFLGVFTNLDFDFWVKLSQ